MPWPWSWMRLLPRLSPWTWPRSVDVAVATAADMDAVVAGQARGGDSIGGGRGCDRGRGRGHGHGRGRGCCRDCRRGPWTSLRRLPRMCTWSLPAENVAATDLVVPGDVGPAATAASRGRMLPPLLFAVRDGGGGLLTPPVDSAGRPVCSVTHARRERAFLGSRVSRYTQLASCISRTHSGMWHHHP